MALIVYFLVFERARRHSWKKHPHPWIPCYTLIKKIKEWQKAVEDYNKAIELNPKWAVPYNNRAYCQMKLRNFKEAKKDLDTSLKLSPKAPTTLVNNAGYYWTAKKDKKNMYANLQAAMKNNFRDFDSLYDENQKGWLFKNINESLEFRSFSAPYSK